MQGKMRCCHIYFFLDFIRAQKKIYATTSHIALHVTQYACLMHRHAHTHTHTPHHTCTRAHTHRRHRRGVLSPSSPLLLNGPLPSPPSGGCCSCSEGGSRPLTPLASSLLLHGSKNKPAGILLVVLLVVAEKAVDIPENDDHRREGARHPTTHDVLVPHGRDDHGGIARVLSQLATGQRDTSILQRQPQPLRAFWPSIDQAEETTMQIEIVTQIEVHDNLATASLVNQSRT